MELPVENKRLKQVIDYTCKGNELAFSNIIGVSQPRINRLFSIDKRNGSYPAVSLDMVQSIINKFIEIDPEWLLTGKGSMLRKDVESGVKNNIIDFETPAAAGCAVLLNEVDKTKATPNLYMPGLRYGTYIRVPVQGDSMHGTIKDGDKAIAVLLHNPHEELRGGHIYVVVDRNDGLVIKRLYKEGPNMVEFVSDNEIYPPYKRHWEDIIAIFKVEEVHTHDLRNYWDDVRRDVRELKQQVGELLRKKA